MSRSLVVFDLELTAWPGSSARFWSNDGEHPEVVQIGAVKADLDNCLVEIASFSRFVKPVRNPILSDYFIDLTGITQNQVEIFGVPFSQALADFLDFAGRDVQAICCNGRDHQVLHMNCQLNGQAFPDPDLDAKFVDLQPFFRQAFTLAPHQAIQSCELLDQTGSEAKPGQAHEAVSDSRSILETLRILNARSMSPFAEGGGS